ncbi:MULTISPECIES: MFS transporter [unclassified Pseudomonas]|uniref:MFS transporter n=1 Tax=unclassified Pseudomonas TaxID=196821 RepID=UPI00119924CB|nr:MULTISPECIES: MFS transporter [unclassified Pseudomonas]TWC16424.1 ACS family hexuronate transporter-like MFS transporter [Pseudomonas sp. SJZ074]TWC18051.1 ACS family hexuronate transporter-like MFS transporter [Pseudomonas sp. SJZ075]TWC34327.1 ACS family hexuronate transporter-like MFS transporter [Pseudomonas sp. SJZ078]TWC34495.1 ACS family hexuronate transporter-like MFS transporter [Pseudomonas sp. SJZ085]TWC55216.1 ACS family hexuronate transporter-like MFS transporter [Pseudomonas 
MKIKGIRWWMVGLVTAGLMVNYLARNTLSVAAPTLMSEMSISTEQYSHIVVAWQVCYALMQPVAGYIIDAIGTKMGFAIFAFAWSIACAAAAMASGWQGLAFFRGLLGLTEAAGLPAAVKASTEWFPAKERSVAIGWFNIGSSIGAVLAPPLVVWAILNSGWELAFLIVGGLGIAWTFLWLVLYKHPRDQKRLSDTERDYIISGQEAHFQEQNPKKGSWKKIIASRNFYAIASARILSEPAWQTFNAWIPLYLMTERHMNIKEIAMFAWLPFLAADLGCVLGGYLSPLFHKYCKVSLFTSRKMVLLFGASCMLGPACIGLVDSPYTAIALLCIGGFAHQTLSGALYAITSDSFGKNEVATATGMGGMFGYLGAAAFTLLFGVMVTQIGYSPLFVMLAIFDVIAAFIVWTVARELKQQPATPAPLEPHTLQPAT